MKDSILETVKKTIGLMPDVDAFDDQIVMIINMAILTLVQIGVPGMLTVTGPNETWSDYLKDRDDILALVKNFIWIKVRLVFAPPQNSTLTNSLNEQLEELTQRIHYAVDGGLGGD